MPVIRETIRETNQTLEAAGIPDARLEAEVMVMTVMRMTRQNIFAEQETEVPANSADDLAGIVAQRLERIPLAYILGYREFYGINVVVTPDVLIPRPETEGMVEHTLFMALMGMETRELSIADVGTGSGAIAVNLAIHLPAARIYAVDASEPALDVAAWNIRAHSVADRVRLGARRPAGAGARAGRSDRGQPALHSLRPYCHTAAGGATGSPVPALDGGPDGLDLVRRMLAQAPAKLNSPGVILLELDPDQFPAAEIVALQHFPDAEITAEQDLSKRDRIMVISRP